VPDDSGSKIKVVPGLTTSVWRRLVGAVSLGIVAAVVQTSLNSAVDPVMSHMASHRCGPIAAAKRLAWQDTVMYFWMILPTNLMKYPVFEFILAVLESVPVPHWLLTTSHWRGMLSGFIFCTLMLPIANTVLTTSSKPPRIYRGYFPTLLRDVVYGMVREASQEAFTATWWVDDLGWLSQALRLGAAAAFACLCASPFNELRAWLLLSKGVSLRLFVALRGPHFILTTFVGAAVMGFSLGVGKCVSPLVEGQAHLLSLTFGTVLLTFAVAGPATLRAASVFYTDRRRSIVNDLRLVR